VVTVEEHTIYGGLGGLVAEVLSADLPKRILRIGIQDCWGESAANDLLLDKYGLAPSRVAERIRAEIQKEAPL
jgi:transketolase